jgi:hypothetical protein
MLGDHRLVGPKRSGRAREHDLARIDDRDIVGKVEREADVLLDEDDRLVPRSSAAR